MTFPLRHTLTHTPYTGDTEDALGNTVPGYGTSVQRKAFAIQPHTVEQGSTTLTQTQVADLDVFMPETAVSLKDRFEIGGDSFEVVGVQDWTKGFHGWEPGIVVELQKVT